MVDILFLDIDGVLITDYTYQIDRQFVFGKNHIDKLKQIIKEKDMKVVVSSTWRTQGLQFLKDLFSKYDIDILDCTSPNMSKTESIENWLFTNKWDSFIVLDDHKLAISNLILIEDGLANQNI